MRQFTNHVGKTTKVLQGLFWSGTLTQFYGVAVILICWNDDNLSELAEWQTPKVKSKVPRSAVRLVA